MSASPARFTFDLDMARTQRKTRVVGEDEIAQMLADARRAGYEEGVAAGRASVEAKAADGLAKAAEKLANNAAVMTETLFQARKAHLEEAVQLSASIARKLAAHLIARQPQAEMAALISECMASLDHAPHLVIRCHPDLCGPMRAAAEERMKSSGFAGRLVVMGDPDIRLGDGRLEWADGGLVRDINAISNDINSRIGAYLAARGVEQQKGD